MARKRSIIKRGDPTNQGTSAMKQPKCPHPLSVDAAASDAQQYIVGKGWWFIITHAAKLLRT